MQEKTEWHRVVFRDRGNFRLGQIAGEYLKKGSKVYVEGRLQTRKWQDKAGVDHYTTEILANEMQMLDSRDRPGPAVNRLLRATSHSAARRSSARLLRRPASSQPWGFWQL